MLSDTADGPFPVSYKIPQISSVFLLPLGQTSELRMKLLYAEAALSSYFMLPS